MIGLQRKVLFKNFVSPCCVEAVKISAPIVQGIPYSIGVRLLQTNGTPHNLSTFSIRSSIANILGGLEATFTVTQTQDLFLLSLSAAGSNSLPVGTVTSDILIRNGNQLVRRITVEYSVSPPITEWIDNALTAAPIEIIEVRDQAPNILQLPTSGGYVYSNAPEPNLIEVGVWGSAFQIAKPILRGLPFAIGLRFLQSDDTPYSPTLFEVRSWLRNIASDVEAQFSVAIAGDLIVLSLSATQTEALAETELISDILVRQGTQVHRRAELVYDVKTPATDWDTAGITAIPDPILVFKDLSPDLLQLPGGTDVESAIASAIDSHEAATNPHPQYLPKEHIFSSPSLTWVLNHNLGRTPQITVLGLAKNQVIADVNHPSSNQSTVTFTSATAGYLVYQ